MSFRRAALFTVLSLLAVSSVSARVLSYSPYTNQPAVPAVQHRMNRHFVLLELSPGSSSFALNGQLVVYDSTGREAPRVVFPVDGRPGTITHMAAREEGGVLSILVRHYGPPVIVNGPMPTLYSLSIDGGATWKQVQMPATEIGRVGNTTEDWGGPYAHGRFSQILIGTAQTPFLVGVRGDGVFAVGRDASTRKIVSTSHSAYPLIGTNQAGTQLIVRSAMFLATIMDLNGTVQRQIALDQSHSGETSGWISPTGAVYLTTDQQQLFHAAENRATLLARGGGLTINGVRNPDDLVAVPTADYSGAWYTLRTAGQSTALYRHSLFEGTKEQWRDGAAPEVEALHTGISGQTVLIQVHRPRVIEQRLFIDPALAIWRVGESSPLRYDELFLDEVESKGFVHLDVDAMLAGEPFVFDSGVRIPSPPLISASPAGGGDVIQEWGVVRSSLRQQLVLPGIGRTPGGFGSNWSSDVTLYNPFNVEQSIDVRYAENSSGPAVVRRVGVTLAAREIRVIEDALRTLFGLESGSGAFYLTPEMGINASSRTYSRAATGGTYGFNMNAIDLFNAASVRFPVSFAGAFPGASFRTNVVLTDAGSGGTDAALTATGPAGFTGRAGVSVAAPDAGQQQANDIGANLGISASHSGGLVVRPQRGFAIASVYAIDNRTNDPTYFPPDLTASVIRTIPAIGHIDGANGSRFRSDLYLYNPSSAARTVMLQAQSWSFVEPMISRTFTLLGNEARVIPDALATLFGASGVARLRYFSSSDNEAIRVTSRTYTMNEDGSTFGFLMPPLNEFQQASTGEALEILGTHHDPRFRTNLGLIDTNPMSNIVPLRVSVELVGSGGTIVDQFEVIVPRGGGLQLNDLFRTRNITQSQPLLIRVRPTGGTVGAFASMLDNITNDPTYIAANLAASQ